MTDAVAKNTLTPIIVAQASDWDLVVALNLYSRTPHIPKAVWTKAQAATWAKQDGYGPAGYTPCQGWDWSGIRDSSGVGHKAMGDACRAVLAGIESFVVEEIVRC